MSSEQCIVAVVIHYVYGGEAHLALLKHRVFPPLTKLTHCTSSSPKYAHPSSVPLRLINKSKGFEQQCSPRLPSVPCGILHSAVVLLGVLLPGLDALLHHRTLQLFTKTAPQRNRCLTPSPAIHSLIFFFLQKVKVDEIEATEEKCVDKWGKQTVRLEEKRQQSMELADLNFFCCGFCRQPTEF